MVAIADAQPKEARTFIAQTFWALGWEQREICNKLGPLQNRKRPHKQNRPRYTKNTENPIFVFLMYFCPILRVAVFSYPVGGQALPKGRWAMKRGVLHRAPIAPLIFKPQDKDKLTPDRTKIINRTEKDNSGWKSKSGNPSGWKPCVYGPWDLI